MTLLKTWVVVMANDDNQPGGTQGGGVAESVVQSEKSRGSFDLRSKRSGSGPNKKMYAIIGLIVVVFLLILIVGWTLLISKMTESTGQVDESKAKADVSLQVDKGNDESMASAKAEKIRQMREQELKEQREREDRERLERDNKPVAPTSGQGAPDRSAPAGNGPPVITPAQRKLGGGLVISPVLQDAKASGATVAGDTGQENRSGDSRSKQPSQQADSGMGDVGLLGGGSASRTRGSLSNLSGTTFAPTQAVLAPLRKYLLPHGTYTRCALYTEIVTDHPGLIECKLTDPLYSADGSTVIADAGDKLTGEQNVEIKPGQVRVFTSWTELETQSGVRTRLDSLGAGPMGASGTEAWIDNHYKERFGGAVILTMTQDIFQSVANLTQKSSGSGGYTVNNSEQNAENMASKALENTINIQPTASILPGTVLTVIVARDIDFSSVFENR